MGSALATGVGAPLSGNASLLAWVEECVRLTVPDRVVWCDGSAAEKDALTREAVRHRSNPNDVARVEHRTFICTRSKEEAGPTNNWMEPGDATRKLGALLDGAMVGRTMYVVPYIMGPAGSPLAKIGVEPPSSAGK